MRTLGVDGGYEVQRLNDGVSALKPTPKIDLEGVERSDQGLEVVKPRGKVERPFAWVSNDRRHARADEGLTAHNEAMIQISTIRRWLKRMVIILRPLLKPSLP